MEEAQLWNYYFLSVLLLLQLLRGHVCEFHIFGGRESLPFSPIKIGKTSEKPFRAKCLQLNNFVADGRNEKRAPFVSRRYTKAILFLLNLERKGQFI